jgi:hypothetical protein
MGTKTIGLMEQQIRTMIKTQGYNEFVTALHNSFSHGEVLTESGEYFTDETLGSIFEGLEKLLEVREQF